MSTTHHSAEDMLKHIRIYLVIFFALAFLTGVTVWASYIHVPHWLHLTIALTIATTKGGLVVAFFMHLISEKKLIYSVCILALFFFIFMVIVTLMSATTVAPLVPHLWG
jgi:cytochrome c oxidase subunit IV